MISISINGRIRRPECFDEGSAKTLVVDANDGQKRGQFITNVKFDAGSNYFANYALKPRS